MHGKTVEIKIKKNESTYLSHVKYKHQLMYFIQTCTK